ncbi:MAG TPA: hypothetical protein VF796_30435 [Humisphaera sp.]
MLSIIKRLLGRHQMAKWALAGVSAMALATPAVTLAAGHDDRGDRFNDRRVEVRRDEHRDDHRGYDRDRHDDHDRRPNIGVDIRIGDRGGWRPGYYERREVWVAPVYRTVVDQRWCEPVYRTVCEQDWVSDLYEDRTTRVFEHGRWCERVEHVLITPAHYESRDRQEVVSPGHYDTFERQELVVAGHYEYR